MCVCLPYLLISATKVFFICRLSVVVSHSLYGQTNNTHSTIHSLNERKKELSAFVCTPANEPHEMRKRRKSYLLFTFQALTNHETDERERERERRRERNSGREKEKINDNGTCQLSLRRQLDARTHTFSF